METTPLPPKLGALKFGWLRMLKNSERNCILKRSFSLNSLKAEKSRRWKPGPGICPGSAPKAAAPVRATQPVGVGVATPNSHGWVKAAGFPIQLSTPCPSLCNPTLALCPLIRMSLQPKPAAVVSAHPKLIGCPPRSEEHTSELQSL